MVYNFKSIEVVPSASHLVDIVLSQTQRKTPTQIHPGYKLSRIRHFYMRKVKFTQQNFNLRLGQILEDFPHMEEIHPFYGTLMNVLYGRDQYKIGLSELNRARQTIDSIGKDYL